jgi:hypothetical protein
MVRADIATIVEGMNWVIQHSKDPWLVSSNILALQSLTGDENTKGSESSESSESSKDNENNKNIEISYGEFMFFGLALLSALTVTSLTVVPTVFNNIYI